MKLERVAFPACNAMGHWELRQNSLTMRDMQQFVPDLDSVIYIVMVLKLMEKANQPPFKRKHYPQVSLKLNQEMESIKSSVLEVIWMDNICVKLYLTTPHCPSCKTQPRLVKHLHLTVEFKFVNEAVALISKLLSKSNKKDLLRVENGF